MAKTKKTVLFPLHRATTTAAASAEILFDSVAARMGFALARRVARPRLERGAGKPGPISPLAWRDWPSAASSAKDACSRMPRPWRWRTSNPPTASWRS